MDDLITAIEIENQRMSLLKKNMAPKRQLIVNQIINHENSSVKRMKISKSNFKPAKSNINWNEVEEHIRKLPKPGDHKESVKPCCYCSQSKVFKVKELSKTHSGGAHQKASQTW